MSEGERRNLLFDFNTRSATTHCPLVLPCVVRYERIDWRRNRKTPPFLSKHTEARLSRRALSLTRPPLALQSARAATRHPRQSSQAAYSVFDGPQIQVFKEAFSVSGVHNLPPTSWDAAVLTRATTLDLFLPDEQLLDEDNDGVISESDLKGVLSSLGVFPSPSSPPFTHLPRPLPCPRPSPHSRPPRLPPLLAPFPPFRFLNPNPSLPLQIPPSHPHHLLPLPNDDG